MVKYVYTVWFRNPDVSSDDPDYEWPACFIVESADEGRAKCWGDHLAARYASSSGQRLVSSGIEPREVSALPGIDTLPIVSDGHEATDEEIGC